MIFHDHPVWCPQNKSIAGKINSTQMRKKQTAKHIWTGLALKLCQLKLSICSVIFSINISLLPPDYEFRYANCMATWFDSHATSGDSSTVHDTFFSPAYVACTPSVVIW